MSIAISVENLGKQYRLGSYDSRSIRDDLNRWWTGLRGRSDSVEKIGVATSTSSKAEGGTLWALRNVNFEIKKGESVGIVGANGAGKSTLLKLLSRITQPTEGKIKVMGSIASLLEVGTGFHPELTGRENIYLNGAIIGMNRDQVSRKLDEIIEFSGVGEYIDTPVKRYSSGMYMRLGFSVAAHLESSILILDEVLSVGDSVFQKKCLRKMSEAYADGRTVLFVSHAMSAVENLCPRAIYIETGKIRADGPSKDIIQSYLQNSNDQVASLDPGKVYLRNDRMGSGEYRFQRVWFTENTGAVTSYLKEAQERVEVHAVIEPNSLSRKDMNVVASLCVRDFTGYRLFTLASAFKKVSFELNGPREVSWIIDKLPLTEGDYLCDLRLADSETDEPIDHVKQAFQFSVLPGDFFKTGSRQGKGLDKFYTEFDMATNPLKNITD
jgi:lipopolysaccharide transport system ATP-binding protein